MTICRDFWLSALSYLSANSRPAFPWAMLVRLACVRDTVHSMISATTQEVSSIFPPRPILSLVSAQNVAIFDRTLAGRHVVTCINTEDNIKIYQRRGLPAQFVTVIIVYCSMRKKTILLSSSSSFSLLCTIMQYIMEVLPLGPPEHRDNTQRSTGLRSFRQEAAQLRLRLLMRRLAVAGMASNNPTMGILDYQ